jgi:short-subunit dehydrogenase
MHIHASTRAIVTGASKGIGRALAEALTTRGATVGLAARGADELAALAEALGPRAIALPCDVGSAEELGAAVERFVAQAGGLDLAIANAGIAHYGRFEDQDPELHERMTRVNWLGTANTARAALPHLRAGGGHLVIVSSGAGLRAFPQAAVYGATKAAQRAFAEALRHELAGTGVSVTTVYPGEIASSLHEHEKATMPEWYHGDTQAAPAAKLASAVLRAIEEDRRTVAYPREVRLLALNSVAPGVVDRLLRRLRGPSAAPRR